MKLIKEIIGDVNKNEKKYKERIASRAIFRKNDKVLMVYSKFFDDYSFPGGGVEKNENIIDTAIRETFEEVGALNTKVIKTIGYVVEYRASLFNDADLFKQTSYYSICTCDKFSNPHLEKYETELGYESRWITIKEALNHNKNLYESKRKSTALLREIAVLEYLEEL